MMTTDELCYLDLLDVSTRMRSRQLSPVEVTQAQLDRIEDLDPDLKSFTVVLADRALDQARQAEREIAAGHVRGPLHGVPLTVKDILDIAGQRTQAGMPIRAGHVADATATSVDRLQDAGAVLLGKQHLTEGVFAEYVAPFEPPVNPWDPQRCAGRSSSGSAVGVAAGLCFGSLGSDTSGSIRLPAAANAVTGLKPTWGRVSRHGAFELAATLDHIGPLARSAADVAALLGVVAGADPRDPTASQAPVPDYLAGDVSSLAGLRVGLDRDWVYSDVCADTAAALDAAVDVLTALGAEVVAVRFPDPAQLAADLTGVCAVQTAVAHADTYPSRRDEYGPALRDLLDAGARVTGVEYQRLLLRRADYRGRLESVMASVDVLLTPAIAYAAATVERMTRMDEQMLWSIFRFTCPTSMSGHPTLTMPGGFTPDGAPVAVQLTGRFFDEHTLLRAGRAFQGATDWHRRRPTMQWRRNASA